MIPSESALIVRVPEAEPLVGTFRDRFDPVARLGVPAHITLLYPFEPPADIDVQVLRDLEDLFAARAPP